MKKQKSRKKFYNNKKRNRKWTEEVKGRKIDFADKYIEGSKASNKFDKKKQSSESIAIKKAKRQKNLKNLVIALMCIAIICVGYTAMDVHMTRNENAYNVNRVTENEESGMKDINMRFSSMKTQSICLDSSVMLSAVINDASSNGFTSITFDAKRSDGTIGYASKLASVDTYNAISSPASKPKPSIKELLANDILPIARVACYKDNVVPKYLPETAVTTKNGKPYKDDSSNTYLNPDSEITYNYIKDIITELSDMGVSVFVLSDTVLPESLSKDYGDGFNSIAKKLYNDIGSNIKLIEEIDVTVSGKNKKNGKISNSAIKSEIAEFEKINKNKTYFIHTQLDYKRLIEQLAKSDVSSYIITQEN